MDSELVSTRLTTEEALKTCEFEKPLRGLTPDRIADMTGASREEVASDIALLVRDNQAHFILDLDYGISRVIPLSTKVNSERLV